MLKALIEKRESLTAELQSMLTKAKTENRAMNDEENKEFERIEKDIKDIDRTIEAEERARKIPVPAKAKNNNNKESEPTAEQLEERAFADFILGRVSENRAEGTQLTQGNNGGIVPTTIANRIITAVKDRVPFLKLCNVIYTNGKLSIPVYNEDGDAFINADYVDEGNELTDNIGKFTTVDLNGFVIGALALVSNKLKDNTDIDVVAFVVAQVADAIAGKLEREFCIGSEDKITGIISAAVGVTAAATSVITYDELVSLKHSIKQIFRGKAHWIMHPSTYTAICKLKDENGIPYFKESDYKILDLPVIESDAMPVIASKAKPIVFGDLTGYSIKGTKSVEVTVLREKFATKNMLGILGFGEFDGAISDGQKIKTLQMA